jgi:hypothetical protein
MLPISPHTSRLKHLEETGVQVPFLYSPVSTLQFLPAKGRSGLVVAASCRQWRHNDIAFLRFTRHAPQFAGAPCNRAPSSKQLPVHKTSSGEGGGWNEKHIETVGVSGNVKALEHEHWNERSEIPVGKQSRSGIPNRLEYCKAERHSSGFVLGRKAQQRDYAMK